MKFEVLSLSAMLAICAQPQRGPAIQAPRFGSTLEMRLVPESGSGSHAVFSAQFLDEKGSADLAWVNVRLSSANSRGECWIAFDNAQHVISLASDDGTKWTAAPARPSSLLENSQCEINHPTYSESGRALTLRLPLTFKPSFEGYLTVSMRAQDREGGVLDYSPRGSWTASDGERIRARVSIATNVPTGVHWPEPDDFPLLARLNYSFAVVTVNPADRRRRSEFLQAARKNRIKLIIGAHPPPFLLRTDGSWMITGEGIEFLLDLREHASEIEALYVFNEPYWIDPRTGRSDPCGVLTPDALRSLRRKIQSVWAGAKIYHDIGNPEGWSPSGHDWKPCIGNKYSNQAAVADYVGIWSYPFAYGRYEREKGLDFARRSSRYVISEMHAIPVFLGQAFACTQSGCAGEQLSMPTAAEMKDWNCSLRGALAPGSMISWYVWRQSPLYSDYLANHSEMWPLSSPKACARQE